MGAIVFRGHLSKRMINAAVDALRAGGLIIYPTDTIYGIGCDMKNKKALDKLNNLKKREKSKPFSFLCRDIAEVSRYADMSDIAFKVMRRTLPGPYTFILPRGDGIPRGMASSDHAVGIRIPDHPITHAIAEGFGSPIITTSVNVSSEEPVNAVGDLPPEFLAAVDVVIDDGPLDNTPSTIIHFTGATPKVIREGKGYENIKPHLEFIPAE